MAEQQPDDAKGQAQGEGSKQQFTIHKIYLKDCSFEAPGAPEIFRTEWKPQVSVDLGTQTKRIDEQSYETVLRITVTATLEDKTAYLCEVHQAGIFGIAGFEGETLDMMLGSYCPANLFPYAREAVSDLVGKGGFPQLLLGPVNFEALYMQKRKQAAKPADQPSNGQA